MEDENKVGRPLLHTDPEKVEHLCTKYFETLPEGKPPTVTGLTLHLGFCDKSSLYDYAKKEQFSHSIKRAITLIEQYHEEQAAYGDKCTGNIFVLKNFGWRDSTDITTNGKDMPTPQSAVINIISPDK